MKSKKPVSNTGVGAITVPMKPIDPNAGDNLNFESISLENLIFIDSDLLLDDKIEMSTLPQNERIITMPYTNQLDTPQSITIKDSYKKITGWKAEFSDSIQNSDTISGSISFKIKYLIFEGGGGKQYEYKTVRTSTYSKSINEIKEETFDISMPFNIPPKQKVEIKTGYRNSNATRKFSGSVVFEADVKIKFGNEWVFVEKSKKLSSILSTELRSFNLNGYYSDIEFKEIPVEILLIEKY
ncbi:hypothetical protein [Chryseobacterium luquanense]|uniref:Insecticidal crystal toxin domain-containing protein n=1 Tax=Chryseobacterium luquanense TaxID=2983766 RepID=A0ABT3XYZ8_9FLAO|nr:hypothetical protein [Chryseobacterium luquanense]MCX8531133.1 hypothetical protein [Chryseobacterium luquanense]